MGLQAGRAESGTSRPTGEQEAIVQKDDNGILQLHLYSPIYNNVRQLTALKGANYDPAWSPTGEWIAFVSTDPGGDEIYRVDPTGAVAQRLTFNTWEWDKHPAWSPDGSQIVFYSNRDRPPPALDHERRRHRTTQFEQ